MNKTSGDVLVVKSGWVRYGVTLGMDTELVGGINFDCVHLTLQGTQYPVGYVLDIITDLKLEE